MTVQLIADEDLFTRLHMSRKDRRVSKRSLSKSTSLPLLFSAPINLTDVFLRLDRRRRRLSAPGRTIDDMTQPSPQAPEPKCGPQPACEEGSHMAEPSRDGSNTALTPAESGETPMEWAAEDNQCSARLGTSATKERSRRNRLRPGLPGLYIDSRSRTDAIEGVANDGPESQAMDLEPDLPTPKPTSLSRSHLPIGGESYSAPRPMSAPTIPPNHYANSFSQSSTAIAGSSQGIPSRSSTPGSSERTLRRKQRMTVMKKKSSCSLRSRASIATMSIAPPPHQRSFSENLHSANLSRTWTPPATGNSQVSFGEPDVRVGHPNRPYYTAIRKNMSRPSTPFGDSAFSVTPPRTPDIHPARHSMGVQRTAMTALDLNEGEGLGWSTPRRNRWSTMPRRSMPAPLRSTMAGGFSVSGEVELRMALARRRSEEEPQRVQEYKFHETPKKGSGSVKGRVRKLGKGLKDFMLGRS